MSFIAMYLISEKDTDTGSVLSQSSSDSLWMLLGLLEAGFLASFGVFLFTIERKYISTFFSTMTGKEFRIQAFRETNKDQMKVNILKLHPSYYESIRGEVGQWVRANWESWNEEKPPWFTDQVKKRFPGDMVPHEEGGGERETETFVAKRQRTSSVRVAKDAIKEALRERRQR